MQVHTTEYIYLPWAWPGQEQWGTLWERQLHQQNLEKKTQNRKKTQ